MRWTDEQQRAIDARGTNLLLSAAAGSGKTTVLVERVLQLVAEGADVDRMLIVTFTRAAAADMRAKLSKSLSARAAEDGRCREQLMRLERASITTLHAFCADFLRSNFEAAGVDPAFRIMDDAENRRLLDEALDEALENAYARGGAALEALDFGRGPAGVRAAAESLYAFLQERPDPWDWLESVQDADAMIPVWENELMNASAKAVRLAIAATKMTLSMPECPANYVKALSADLPKLEEMAACGDYEALREGLANFKQTRPTGRTGLSEEEMKPVKAARKSAADALRAARITMLPKAQSEADMRASVFALGALAGIVRDVAQLHESGKREAAGLTYSDLEHFTLRALRDDDTARAMQEKYDFVFVDEYQDTSDVQEAIVSRVRRADNLFMVGDVKQSIYRFRLAEPRLFLEKYALYRQGEGGELLPLTRNFRSAGPVLDFTNAVFERMMTGGDAEVEYDELARLNAGTEEQKAGAPVEIHIISGEAPEEVAEADEDNEEEAEMVEGAQREGALIAAKIIEMMREDPSLRYRDFVILTRARTSAFSVILPMLAAHGIPAYADGAEGFFESMEISLVLEILQLIANRRSDVALIGVLRSPVAGLTNEELARIRIASPRTPYLDAALACAENSDALGAKLKGFFEKLDSWRMRAGVLSLDALVRAVLDESGFYAYAGALPAGAQRQANLDAFVNRAARFDKDVSGSLTRFLRYTEDMRARGDGDAAHLLGENDDVVRLMTVHRSKGLEFKVVFGALLGRGYPYARVEDTLLAHRDLGVGMLHIDPNLRTRRTTLAREAVSERARRENAAEEMRILYVLLTRAQEKLILTGTVKRMHSAQRRWQMTAETSAAAKSHLDLLMGALESAQNVPVQIEVHRADEFFIRPQADEGGELRELLDRAAEGELPGAENALYEAMRWKYPDELASRKPLKLTASGLLRELEGPGELPPLAPRPQFMSEGGMTGAERGTAYHRALQGIDLRPLAGIEGRMLIDAVRLQLDAMARDGRLLKAEREAVSPTRIAEFLLSDAGRRLQASDTIRREWPFNVMMRANEALTAEEAGEFGEEDLLVQGTIDCCFEEGGEWVLLDYKTDRTDDMDALRAHYEKQLHVYALALERITGMRVKEKKLCLLAQGKVLEM